MPMDTPHSQLSPRKKTIMGIVLVVFVMMVMMGMAEGFVRIRQYLRYGFTGTVQDIYQMDPVLKIRVPIPNLKQKTIQINSLGFRSPELEMPKPPATIRLAFLGGSTTFCAEVSSNAMTWPHLVWQQLQTTYPDAHFDYVNASASGYLVHQSQARLTHHVKPLAPDIIVIYHATNDLARNTNRLARAKNIIPPDLTISHSWLSRYSVLWLLVEKNLQIWQRQQQAKAPVPKLTFTPEEITPTFQTELTSLIRESQQIASVVAVVTFTTKLRREQTPDEQLHAANTFLYYMPYMSIEGLLQGFEAYNRVIRDVAQETGAILIEGEYSIPGDDVHFNDSMHFNDPGSVLMAKRVSDGLVQSEALHTLIQTKHAASPGQTP